MLLQALSRTRLVYCAARYASTVTTGRSTEAEEGSVTADLREFFLNPDHRIYSSKGTPSWINADSVYHISQLQVLFEDRHFHLLTYRAIQELKESGFLRSETVKTDVETFIVVWRSGVRYVRRAIKAHVTLAAEYSSQLISKATGDYAETLALLGLRGLGLTLVDRNTRSYRHKTWTESEHDLDFVVEKDGRAYGVEVKNTLDYMPRDELDIKIALCQHLGIRPLFIVRNRDKIQWDKMQEAGGLLYIFKSKIFPPGQEPLVQRIWKEMRLPVAIWRDWHGQFYNTIADFINQRWVDIYS